MPSIRIKEFVYTHVFKGFSSGASCKESSCQCRRCSASLRPQPWCCPSFSLPSLSHLPSPKRDLSLLKGNVALVVKMLPARAGDSRRGFSSWVRKIPGRRKWQPTPVFLPGDSHGQRSLAGYSLWGHQELDMTKRLTLTQTHN